MLIPLGHCASHLHRECPRCFLDTLLGGAIRDVHWTDKKVPQVPRSPVFDQPKHPSLGLADHRITSVFTASLPHSSSRQVAYPTLHAHKRPVVACDEADKLSHLLHVLAWLTRAVCCFHHTNRIVVPLNLTSCALQSKPELPLNFASPYSKLSTPCDFAWLCCGLTFPVSKLWTRLLRPPELVHSAHCRYACPGLVFSPKTLGELALGFGPV